MPPSRAIERWLSWRSSSTSTPSDQLSEYEVDVFEAWFGDILDELFGAPWPGTGSSIGSS
jgi:hypothetical protein